jgi:exosortase/archaeosortase family protein
MRPRMKLAGIAIGALLIYLVNIIRIVSLYYLRVHRPDIFELFHATFWQAAIVVMAWLFFMFWVGKYGAKTEPGRAVPE